MFTLRLLFRSRKFMVALFGLVLAVLTQVAGLDAETAQAVTIAIITLASSIVLGIAVEDHGHNMHNGRMGQPKKGDKK